MNKNKLIADIMKEVGPHSEKHLDDLSNKSEEYLTKLLTVLRSL